jgi:hypothetical protein
VVAGSPRLSQHLQPQFRHSYISSAQSIGSKSWPGTPQLIEHEHSTKMHPARFTFGDGAVGGWTLGDQGSSSPGIDTLDSGISTPPRRIQTFGFGEAL